MEAIIETGGKQYRVSPGMRMKIEKINGSPGEEVKFDKVLLSDNDGKISVGSPLVPGVTVIGEIVSQDRGKKKIVYKRRPKKGYRKTVGHRQYFTEIKIKEIQYPNLHK